MDGVSVSSLERTARWVQTHAVRQHGDPQPHSGSRSRGTARRHAHGHDSSPHSSRTDITPPSRTPTTTVRYNVAPAQAQAIRIAYAHSSKKGGGEHQQRRSRGRSQPPTPIERPVNPISRLHIPTELYHSPNLPAFVQGPPGSGYPMTMTPIRTPDRERVVFPTGSPPSPPPKIPSQLNPKKSRPTAERRRPSLSGATFDPPLKAKHSTESGYGETRRLRKRATSESRVPGTGLHGT